MTSEVAGRAQLFLRASPKDPYTEEASTTFHIEPGERVYDVDLWKVPGWGTIQGLRLDPVEQGEGGGKPICIKEIRLVP